MKSKMSFLALFVALAMVLSGCGQRSAPSTGGTENTGTEATSAPQETSEQTEEDGFTIPPYADFSLTAYVSKINENFETVKSNVGRLEIQIPQTMDMNVAVGDNQYVFTVEKYGQEGVLLSCNEEMLILDEDLQELGTTTQVQFADCCSAVIKSNPNYLYFFVYDYMITESGEGYSDKKDDTQTKDTVELEPETVTEPTPETQPETQTQPEATPQSEPENMVKASQVKYEEILRKIVASIQSGEESADGEFSYVYPRYGSMPNSEFGFAVIQTGEDEYALVVGENGSAEYPGILYDMYTIVEGELKHVFCGGERDRYYATEIQNAFIEEADSTADASFSRNYIVEKGELTEAEFYTQPQKINLVLTPFKK